MVIGLLAFWMGLAICGVCGLCWVLRSGCAIHTAFLLWLVLGKRV